MLYILHAENFSINISQFTDNVDHLNFLSQQRNKYKSNHKKSKAQSDSIKYLYVVLKRFLSLSRSSQFLLIHGFPSYTTTRKIAVLSSGKLQNVPESYGKLRKILKSFGQFRKVSKNLKIYS